jgi:hypothetical protein
VSTSTGSWRVRACRPHGRKSVLVVPTAAAGERPAISRHSRHSRHWSYQVALSKKFAPMTRIATPRPARVMDSALASCARPFVWVVPIFGIDPMTRRCGSVPSQAPTIRCVKRDPGHQRDPGHPLFVVRSAIPDTHLSRRHRNPRHPLFDGALQLPDTHCSWRDTRHAPAIPDTPISRTRQLKTPSISLGSGNPRHPIIRRGVDRAY